MSKKHYPKEKPQDMTITITRHGYEYTLVFVGTRPMGGGIPYYMDQKGYALKSFKKLQK